MKLVFNVFGTIALLLALLGLFLPLLPTTPFLLLASACYMRGSARMHRWLLDNRLFGSHLRNYQVHRSIPLRAKYLAITLTWASLLASIATVRIPALQIGLACIGLGVTCFIARMKTLPRSDLPAAQHEDQ